MMLWRQVPAGYLRKLWESHRMSICFLLMQAGGDSAYYWELQISLLIITGPIRNSFYVIDFSFLSGFCGLTKKLRPLRTPFFDLRSYFGKYHNCKNRKISLIMSSLYVYVYEHKKNKLYSKRPFLGFWGFFWVMRRHYRKMSQIKISRDWEMMHLGGWNCMEYSGNTFACPCIIFQSDRICGYSEHFMIHSVT